MTRNQKYEQKMKQQGLKKVTLWIPFGMEADFHQLASACCKNGNLSFDSLRDLKTGRYVSLNRI
ncbi:hypothetical protein ACVO8F_002617 [Vibrio cholerae]